jgi:hypothetical protein
MSSQQESMKERNVENETKKAQGQEQQEQKKESSKNETRFGL